MYPDKDNKNLGIFIQKEVEALSKYCDCQVICPRPWRGFKISQEAPGGIKSNVKVHYPGYFPKFFGAAGRFTVLIV